MARSRRRGDVATVEARQGGRRSPSPRGVVVGPAGLAIPVAGVKPDQLTDTFTQARAGGARRHDAIDIMAAEGTPVIAARRRHGRETVLLQRRRRDHRLCALARRAAGPIIMPIFGLCAGPRRGAAGQARPADRPRRPYRRRQRRRARISISRSTRWRRASAGGRARRSIPIRCLPGRRPAARARQSAGQLRGGSFIFKQVGDHEDQRRGHPSRQHHRI